MFKVDIILAYFSTFYSISIVDFDQVNISWESGWFN